MKQVYENREEEFKKSFDKSIEVHRQWNWEDITAKHAVPRIKEIYGELNV
jgi:hypothetical protein